MDLFVRSYVGRK